MKRILGQGYIEDLGPEQSDSHATTYGPDHVYLIYKVKVPVLLQQLFRDYGKVNVQLDLFNEFYTPSFFYKQDGTKCSDKECNELNTKFKNYYRFLANFHDKLAKQGILLEQLASILPFGIFSVFTWYITLQDVMDFLYNNLESHVPENKEIAQALLAYFKEEFSATASKFLQDFSRREQP